jgi:hypothetical protein
MVSQTLNLGLADTVEVQSPKNEFNATAATAVDFEHFISA